jgi:organic radical activating enzyme
MHIIESMTKECLKLGIKEDHIFKDIKLIPQATLHMIEVYLIDSCNLNCAGCNAFSPLVQRDQSSHPSYTSGEFKKDIDRLSLLLHRQLKVLNLMGGEPLLHPEIDSIAEYARRSFPYTEISIVTNGILLSKMPDTFWKICKENSIIISITKYPIKLNFDKLSDIAEKNGVNLRFHVADSIKETSWNIALDCSGKQTPYESFVYCGYANRCVRLKNGRLSTCPLIFNIEFFNQYFNQNLQVCPNDYIDIYEAKNDHEILNFLAKPVPFCRYCDVNNRTWNSPWHTSKREISEWIIEKS